MNICIRLAYLFYVSAVVCGHDVVKEADALLCGEFCLETLFYTCESSKRTAMLHAQRFSYRSLFARGDWAVQGSQSCVLKRAPEDGPMMAQRGESGGYQNAMVCGPQNGGQISAPKLGTKNDPPSWRPDTK